MSGAGAAAAPLTGTFVGAELFGVQRVATARGELFHINALLRSCGHASPARFARKHADAADVLTVLVGQVQYVCVTLAGVEKVLREVLEFAEGLENAQALAGQLGFERGGEGEEDDEEAAAAVPPDEADYPDRPQLAGVLNCLGYALRKAPRCLRPRWRRTSASSGLRLA